MTVRRNARSYGIVGAGACQGRTRLAVGNPHHRRSAPAARAPAGQAIGTFDYALKPWLTLRLGCRSRNFNYPAADRLGFNLRMKGPILAGTFRF